MLREPQSSELGTASSGTTPNETCLYSWTHIWGAGKGQAGGGKSGHLLSKSQAAAEQNILTRPIYKVLEALF